MPCIQSPCLDWLQAWMLAEIAKQDALFHEHLTWLFSLGWH